ncbi:putative oxidoreductase GLYR1 homolog [Caerostris extrusa]|uniref:Cytokine-like nuclear factor N-PAC n=1 Tax=Caerostris extrusa TaxID=172846 RepID=A0AAV4MLZ2_CAEEX|nr:putative oxidoreductase GLYR1 homolog [Caerostris extrusa]
MVAQDLEVGDLVWAKMKSFPPWPAQIVVPPEDAKNRKGKHYVFFFGSKNYAWIKTEDINHHDEQLIPPPGKKRTLLFQNAVDEIVNLSKDKPSKAHKNVYVESPSKIKETKSKNLPGKERSSFKSEIKISNDIKANGESSSEIKKKKPNDVSISEENSQIRITPKKVKSLKRKQIVKKVSSKKMRIEQTNSNSQTDNIQNEREDDSTQNENTMKDHSDSSTPSYFVESSHEDIDRPSPGLPFDVGEEDDLHSRYMTESSSHHFNASPFIDDILRVKYVQPTSMKIGFLGLGQMGRAIVRNLLQSGHDVTVWNRTPGKCIDFIKMGASSCETPAEVVKATDIIFCCISDPLAVRSLVFGLNGVLKGLEESFEESHASFDKGYVELTSIDYETSQDIAEAITIKGAKYLDGSVLGSKLVAEEGQLIILASGDFSLFSNCETCFHAITSKAYYVSCHVGQSSKFSIVISTLMGTVYAALSECMSLAERIKISQQDLLDILQVKGLAPRSGVEKGRLINMHKFNLVNTPLKHQQKDIDLALNMSDNVILPMPVVSAANELYKHAKLLGYGDHDVAAVYQSAKH